MMLEEFSAVAVRGEPRRVRPLQTRTRNKSHWRWRRRREVTTPTPRAERLVTCTTTDWRVEFCVRWHWSFRDKPPVQQGQKDRYEADRKTLLEWLYFCRRGLSGPVLEACLSWPERHGPASRCGISGMRRTLSRRWSGDAQALVTPESRGRAGFLAAPRSVGRGVDGAEARLAAAGGDEPTPAGCR